MKKGAIISECGQYRYHLWRTWDDDRFKPRLAFIMLNPSTADAENDDPTIRRVINFAKAWGYGGIDIFNLFAYITSSPKILYDNYKKGVDVIGSKNNDTLIELKLKGNNYDIVFAWGAQKEYKSRIKYVEKLFPFAECLKKTKEGYPCHPLYLKSDLKRIEY